MKENRVHFSFEGRYYTVGEPGPNIKSLWFVLHGHGHLAQFFIKKFNSLDDGKTLVVAPEGLNRYYLEGFTGKVGSTWMTKEDRLTDIRNYITFLDSVYNDVLSNEDLNPNQINFLGFSQGAATVSRWAIQGTADFDRLILWSGIFPPDMDFEVANKILSGKEIISVFGDKDEFVTEERWKEFLMLEEKLQVETKKVQFGGGHELNEAVLQKLN